MKRSLLDQTKRLARRKLTDNLRLKLLAGVITILVFILVRGGREATARVIVEVEVLPPEVTASRVLMTEVPDTVTLRVQGAPGVVQQLDNDEIPPVTLDLRDQQDGLYRIDPLLFRVPPGVEINSVRPASISLRYEDRIERQVHVIAAIGGQAAEGYHVKDPVVAEPNTVTLSGPRSLVREMVEVRTELINVDGLGPGTHRRQIALERPHDHSRYIGGDQVTVIVIVEPDVIERTFGEIAVEVRGTALTASSEQVSITLRGPADLLERFDRTRLTAFVELGDDGLRPGAYRREVRVEGADSPLQVVINPATVIVEVTEQTGQPQQGSDAAPVTNTHP